MKTLASLASAALILATLATAVQAKQVVTDTRKLEQIEAQQAAKAQAQAPCFWLVLGVGY